MNKFQLTTQDYLAYIQMSNHQHVLVENNATKQVTDPLVWPCRKDVSVDDLEHLVDFDRSHTNLEQIGIIYSGAISNSCGWKLVKVIHGPSQSIELLPITNNRSLIERANEVLDAAVSVGININARSAVHDYLLLHNDLIDLLPLIIRVISEEFGRETELSLELYRDPEIEDSYLAVFGRTEFYDEDFLETIKNSRARYMDLLTGKSGWILITTDFDSPNTSTTHALQLD